MDPATGTYSEKLANACDMSFLHNSSEWALVRNRPKTFVEKLLVLDEDKRMTAKQALHHEWFSNVAHKTNFEELYQRTIKHWRPSLSRRDVVEFQDASFVQSLMFPRRVAFEMIDRGREKHPIDAHCKPVPRRMFSEFWPKKRKSSLFASEEIQAAISRWPSRWKSQGIFDDDDDEDDAEADLLARKTKRQGVLRSNQRAPRSPAARGQRSSSAPPRLTVSMYPFTPQFRRMGDRSTPKAAPNTASSRLQAPTFRFSQSPRPISRKQSPLRESVSCHSSSALEVDKETARTETPSLSVQHQETVRQWKHINQHSVNPIVSHSLSSDLGRQAVDTNDQYTLPGASPQISTPVRPGALKRWSTSPGQDFINSRSSSKRRRDSIFDIEEDDAEKSPTHERALKHAKKVKPLPDASNRENGENEKKDDEITLPHHPISLRGARPDMTTEGLYLPR